MEPRWIRSFDKKFEFVGGTRKVDIYVSTSDGVTEVRFVWGPDGAHSWHWVSMDRDKGCVSEEMDITDEQFNEVRRYLALFAPDWRERAPIWSLDDEP